MFIVYQKGDILVTEVGDDVKNKKKKCRSWVRYWNMEKKRRVSMKLTIDFVSGWNWNIKLQLNMIIKLENDVEFAYGN